MSESRIRPPAKYDELLEWLVGKEGIFETKHQVLMFAAALGKYNGRREPIEKYGEGIRWDIFAGRSDDHFIRLLALAETGDIEVLDNNQDEKAHVRIFEEYAAGGLAILKEQYVSQPGSLLDNLMMLIAKVRSQDGSLNSGLEGLSPAALNSLVGGL